jgi:aerobic C4-dicarboxylate transport protein
MHATHATTESPKKKSRFGSLYVQVVAGIILGVALGHFYPDIAKDMKPLGDGFIKLIKMIVGPIIFCTVVTGIAAMDDMKSAGRIGVKAMFYFFIASIVTLFLGLLVANVFQPGANMNIDPATLDRNAVASFITNAPKEEGLSGFLLHIIPTTAVEAFASGELLQVLFFALLFAGACSVMGKKAKPVVQFIDDVCHIFFVIIGFIMKLAPLGAFGAMAFTVGEYGIAALVPLGKLMLCFYFTCLTVVFVLLASVLRYTGLSIWRFIVYIKEEIFIVFGTCSSETVLPRMMDKLEALGCPRSLVGMVLPTGYSFNLEGTAIYLTMAAIFLAQATNTELTIEKQMLLLGVMMLTSKGAAGVVGTAFVALAATLASMESTIGIPVAAVALILGVDRFLAEGRAVTNLIGNGVATIFMAKWEGVLDVEKARSILSGKQQAKLESEGQR